MTERYKIFDLFEEHKETINKRINEGIETYRKGNATISVVDKSGNPLSGASLKLSQKTHEFRFGANLFMLNEMETAEKNELYKKRFAEIFNMATLPFYWDAIEPEEGKTRYEKDSPKIYRRPSPDLCIEFCKANGIEPREHALAYEHFFPKWLHGKSDEVVKAALERRFKEIGERYASEIDTIEVTNEMNWSSYFVEFYNDPDFVTWCFKTARKYFPFNKLSINESSIAAFQKPCRGTSPYYAYTEAAMLKGAPIDAIGMQFHLFHTREKEYEYTRMMLDPINLFKQMDLYARFGKPLQITEVTFPAFSGEKEDEEVQARMVELLYPLWFSHPNMEQIVYWNLVDGYAHLADPDPAKIAASQGDMTVGENVYYGGLLRFDMSPKPAYEVMKNLILNVWHTEETLTADENGTASMRGFFGDYEVEVAYGGKVQKETVRLSKNGDNQFTLVLS